MKRKGKKLKIFWQDLITNISQIRDKRFIHEIAKEAIKNAQKTQEQSGNMATIIEYRTKTYLRIRKFLIEINKITNPYHVRVSVDDEGLSKNEIRVYLTSNKELQRS